MKVGDLVKWASVQNDEQEEFDVDYGIIVQITWSDAAPPAGVPRKSAKILWPDETMTWMDMRYLEIVNREFMELTDEQLEAVRGGMSPPLFEEWRTRIINDLSFAAMEELAIAFGDDS